MPKGQDRLVTLQAFVDEFQILQCVDQLLQPFRVLPDLLQELPAELPAKYRGSLQRPAH